MSTRLRSWAAVDMERVGCEGKGGCDQFCKVRSGAGIYEDFWVSEEEIACIPSWICQQENPQLYTGERLTDQGQLLPGLRPGVGQLTCGR